MSDLARPEGTIPIHESTRMTQDSTITNRTTSDSNLIESDQSAETGGESNLRDAFTSYFMFDDDERVEPGQLVKGEF